MAVHRCSMCHYFSDDVNSLLHHLVRKHQNAATFIAHCNVAGCGATYANVRSFKKHLQRKHPSVPELAPVHDELADNDEVVSDDDGNDNASEINMESAEAAFVLKLKAAHNLSDVALNEVMSSSRELTRIRMDSIRRRLQISKNNIY